MFLLLLYFCFSQQCYKNQGTCDSSSFLCFQGNRWHSWKTVYLIMWIWPAFEKSGEGMRKEIFVSLAPWEEQISEISGAWGCLAARLGSAPGHAGLCPGPCLHSGHAARTYCSHSDIQWFCRWGTKQKEVLGVIFALITALCSWPKAEVFSLDFR